jgi:hypothetical protein
MPASFQLSPEDFRLFQRAAGTRFARQHGRFGAPFLLNAFGWFCVAMAATAFFRLWEKTPYAARPFGVLIALMFVGFLAAIAMPHAAERRFMRHALSPRGSFLAPQTVRVSEEGLFFTSGASRSEVPWSTVLGRVEDGSNHYLFLDGMHAIIIPKAAVEALGPVFEQKLREISVEV